MKISEWLHVDPVSFHNVFQKHKLNIDKEIFKILVSKLRANHFEYFKNSLRLNMRIDFKGFDVPVKAIIPYKDKPVEFYKWWCNNEDQVIMNTQEKLILFNNVYIQKPDFLKSKHRKMLNK